VLGCSRDACERRITGIHVFGADEWRLTAAGRGSRYA
jgi:hypothetical protein